MNSSRRRSGQKRASARKARNADPEWVDFDDDALLKMRVCDLKLRIPGTILETRITRLHEELASRDIRFRPHCWLSDEWFSPDGIPGIAIPFYLAHPRLIRLERKQMLEAEGSTDESCMKILRHEAGHAVDTAYRLSRRKIYRAAFGRSSKPYPEYYQPKPYSQNYVQHLGMWYAQSHPVEDFAETFAVWMRPFSRWRAQYRRWPALSKLECVDKLVDSIAGLPAKLRTRQQVEPLRLIRKTLGEHYRAKRQHYGVDHPELFDHDLRRLFAEANGDRRGESAAAFLRRVRPELRKRVSKGTGQYRYTIDQVLAEMIERCRELKLRRDRPEDEAKLDAMVILTVQTMNFLHDGHHRVAL